MAGQLRPPLSCPGRRLPPPQLPGAVRPLLAKGGDLPRQGLPVGLHFRHRGKAPLADQVQFLQRLADVPPQGVDLRPVHPGRGPLWVDAQLVAVVEVQPEQAARLMGEHSPAPIPPRGRMVCRPGPQAVFGVEIQIIEVGAVPGKVLGQRPLQGGPVVFRSQPVDTHRPSAVQRTEGGVFAALLPPPEIPLLPQHPGEVPLGAGLRNGLADGPAHRLVPGLALPFVERPGLFASWLPDDRQGVLPAQLVGNSSQVLILAPPLLILLAVHIGHRIDDEVVVQTSRVQMGGHQHLEPPAPHPTGQFHPDGVALLRSHLPGLETLVGVHGHYSFGFAELLLHRPHLRPGGGGAAVDAAHQLGRFPQDGFLSVLRVVQRLGQTAVLGLVRVGGVVHHAAQAVPHRPNFSGRQRHPPSARGCPAALPDSGGTHWQMPGRIAPADR